MFKKGTRSRPGSGVRGLTCYVLEAADGYELTLANFVEANIKPTGGAFVSVSSDSETKTVTLILSIAAVD